MGTGLPAAETARVTTLPAPITAREPIPTPARTVAAPPTHTSDPMSIGFPELFSAPVLRVERMQLQSIAGLYWNH